MSAPTSRPPRYWQHFSHFLTVPHTRAEMAFVLNISVSSVHKPLRQFRDAGYRYKKQWVGGVCYYEIEKGK